MKKVLSIACAAALVCGCAIRPKEGPGSRYGADYVPKVESMTVDSTVYEQDVAKCRASAESVPFNATRHDDALVAIDSGAVAIGISTAWSTPVAWAAVATMAGFNYAVYMPERTAWWSKQETVMMNCMAQKGYINADPTVRVTWVPPAQRAKELGPRPTGVDTYNAEKLAKAQSCSATPLATLQDKGPGFERYTIPCSNGQVMTVRCEFGSCRIGQTIALAR